MTGPAAPRKWSILIPLLAILVAIAIVGYLADLSIVVIWPVMILVAALGAGVYYAMNRSRRAQSSRKL